MSTADWLAPAPLWESLLAPTGATAVAGTAAADRAALRRPTLLRFDVDDFMPRTQDVLRTDPARLAGFVARGETWRRPVVGLGAPSTAPLKLFQPAQQRFYLLTASLACRVPGLPDHTVQAAEEERVSCVLRRVRPPASMAVTMPPDSSSWTEQAWIEAGDASGWRAADGAVLEHDEERLPVFALPFKHGDLTRAVRAAFVPVARRQRYATAPELDGSSTPARILKPAPTSYLGRQLARKGPITPVPASPPSVNEEVASGIVALQQALVDPWVNLVEWAAVAFRPGWHIGLDDTQVRSMNTALELGSSLVLLDTAHWLRDWLPVVWAAVEGGTPPAPGSAARALHDALDVVTSTGQQFRQAIADAAGIESTLETTTSDDQRMDLPLGTTEGIPTPSSYQRPRLDNAAWRSALLDRAPGPPWEVAEAQLGVRPIVKLARAALLEVLTARASMSTPPAPLPTPVAPPQDTDMSPDVAWYIARFVYERPRCGDITMSDPSEPFQLASFFDPDAPARPIQVALPIDTSPSALRKYDKKVVFALSDELKRQMSRVTGLKDLMDGKVGSPAQIDFGVLCSLSIPIITICALIVLMIMVSLLNIVFQWIPFFMMCFPVPRLKAKGGAA